MSDQDEPWLTPGPTGATPLDPDDRAALKPDWVTTRGDLNLVERDNIAKALRQRKWGRLTTTQLLDDKVIRDLHVAMFGDVWRWAGMYRTAELNIGVDPGKVSVAVKSLVDDAQYWFATADVVTVDRVACMLHHELVRVHPFRNGNGRVARHFTDLLLGSLGQKQFTWGRVSLDVGSRTRETYIDALRAADRGDLNPLVAFVRT